MECDRCGVDLERPGEYCLVCHTGNCEAVVVAIEPERAELTPLGEDGPLQATTVTTRAEADAERAVVQRRNYVGRIADELRRRRPDAVYAAGERDAIRALRDRVRYPFYRVSREDPVEDACSRRESRELAVDDRPPAAKIGGAHSTLIGGRDGRTAVQAIAGHHHVKKVVPGPIDASGSGSRGGVRAKATRSDENGNLRLLLRDGSSVQENRIVTTARDRETGERVRTDLNEVLAERDLAPADG